MSKEMKFVPELRFPEFEGDGEWVESMLGDEKVSRIVNDKIDSEKLTIKNYISTDNMLPDYSGVIDASKLPSTNRVTEFLKGDILISNIRPYLKKVWKSDRAGGASNDVLIFRAGPIVACEFLEFILKNDVFINYVMQSAKGVKMPRGDKDSMIKYPIRIPRKQEQQKIASCLSSLDELIAAHNDKLDALKDHKKGLLQNLFPQEGETVPKVRFSEFEGDGEWQVKKLDKLGELINGLTYSPKDVRDEGLLVLRSSNIQNGIIDFNDCVYVRTDIKGANLSQPKDILVCVRNGSKRLIGKNAIIPESIPLATHGAFMTVFRASNPDFVFQLFQSDAYDKQVKADLGATINSINGKNFIRYEFTVPSKPEEQQKIATCLSAADELITAQQEKIEQLQQHKKGLMQGLFPNPSASSGETIER